MADGSRFAEEVAREASDQILQPQEWKHMAPEEIQNFSATDLTLGGVPLDDRASGEKYRSTPLDDLDGIVALYQPRVFRFLLATLRDRDSAETLTQETFLRAWNARDSFREDCSIATWLIRIALNLARDHTRTGRFRFWKRVSASAVDVSDVATSIPNHECSAEAQLIAQQQVAGIWKTVDGLSERQRSIFLLRFLEEMEIAEIATVTGLPVSTVKSHLYRALAIVRTQHNPPPRDLGSRRSNSHSLTSKETL
jgi:RNA polymerase sigma-70 factor (ECF subfamily)